MLRRSLRLVGRYSPEQLDALRLRLAILTAALFAGLVVSCHESPVQFRELPMASATTGVTFVQATATSNASRTIAVPLPAATTQGNLVVVGFDYTGTSFTSITDNQGNAFIQVGTEITTPGGARTRLYYARNIKGGSETVTINLAANAPYLEVYVIEYAGADTANPLDVSAQRSGSTSSVTSGAAVTTSANDLLLAYCVGDNSCTAGSGFTARSTYHSNLLEDRTVTTAGSYAGTGTANSGWAIIMAAFRPQSATPPAPVASVAVAPPTASMIAGATQALTATTRDASGNVLTGRTIAWTTSNAAVATVSATGVVSGIAAGGPVTITATSEGKTGTAAITVTVPPVATLAVAPASTSVSVGQTVPLSATTRDANGTVLTGRDITWETSDLALATVSATGVVTGVAAGGPVTITATSEGQSDTAQVMVTMPVASVTVAPAEASVVLGQTLLLSAATKDANGEELTGRAIIWTTSNALVATVSAEGVVTGVAAGGPVTITATSEGQTGTAAVTVTLPPVASVTVSPTTASVVAGQTAALTASIRDANGTGLTSRAVTWEASDPSLARVSADGVVTGVAPGGPVTITATSEGMSGSAAITVLPAVASVTIAPPTASVIAGQALQLAATTSDATGTALTGRVITWTTGNAAVATVSPSGVVTGLAVGGPVTITATSEGQNGGAEITVTPVPVASVTIAPATANVIVGQSVTFQATPKDAAGSTLSGRAITWTTSDPALATVSASGVVSGVAAGGPATITAASEGQVGSAAITVQALSPTGYVFPLKVGPTSRYLVDQIGKPFFFVGDAAWSLFSQLSDQDADTYLAARQQSGFNAVMANVIEHKFATNAPSNIYGQAPFTGKTFTTPNEAYFAHIDYILQSAAEKGIVVLLAPAYVGYQCGSQGWCAELKAATTADLTTWGRYLGARYRTYDNIVWMIGGDADPSASGVKTKLQALVDGILESDTRHLFTAHNAPEQMAITPWSGASWLTVNHVYTYSRTLYRAALNAYRVAPAIPYLLIESRYDGEGASAQQLRAQSYWTVLSGGTGQVYGACPMWHFAAPSASSFCASTNWRAQLTNQGSRNMQYLQKLFTARHWQLLVPDEGHTAVTAGYGSNTSTGYVTAATASDGSSIIAYLPSSRTVTVSGRALGSSMTAWWYNPANGASTTIGTYSTSTTRSFTPPSSGDWVLVVDKPSLNFPPP